MNPEGERILCDWAAKEHRVDTIFVDGVPRKKRPYCTFPLDSRITMGLNCLFRELEITTGSRRINEYRHAPVVAVHPGFASSTPCTLGCAARCLPVYPHRRGSATSAADWISLLSLAKPSAAPAFVDWRRSPAGTD